MINEKLKNKLAGLLAVASVTSMVPAQVAFASTSTATRLESQEGTIEKAIALDNGKYLYNGYKTDDQESGAYLSTGTGTDKPVSEDDIVAKYGTKFVELDDSSDNVLDVTTGKVSEDDDLDSVVDNANRALYKKLKKVDDLNIDNQSDITITREANDTFRDNMYKFSVADLKGIADEDGKYVATNKIANIQVYDAANNKLVKVDKFDHEDNGYKATLDSFTILGENKDNYFVLSKVTVAKDGFVAPTTLLATTGAAVALANTGTATFNYIQVVSKNTETDDDIEVPKTVTSYMVTNDIYSGDAPDIDKVLDSDTKFAIANGKIFYYTVSGTELEVGKVTLKQDSVELKDGASKVQAKHAIVEDVDTIDLEDAGAVSVDTDGAIWCLADGKIAKYVDDSFEDIYKVGSGYNHLDVYNKDNLIAWDDDDSFVTVKGAKDTTGADQTGAGTGTAVDNGTGGTVTTQISGWVKAANGTWSYFNAGIKATGWVKDAGKWYFLDAQGVMKTGWVKDAGKWYFLNASGDMATGWLKDTDGSWYYLFTDGSMAADTVVDGYQLGSNGAWVK